MKTSPISEVRELYEKTADSYSEMMDVEIDLPVYPDILSRLAERIKNIAGHVVDTSCGSGHMLQLYHSSYDSKRSLLGIDLSSRMVEIANKRLGNSAKISIGDMRDVSMISSDSSAAVLSFFSIHHLDKKGILTALKEWNRILCEQGQLLVAAWEGTGLIDYGDASNIEALKYTKDEVTSWAVKSGFIIDRCKVSFIKELSMNAIYLEASKK